MRQPGFFRSLRHAADGVAHFVRTQRNARRHLVAAALVVAAGAWLRVGSRDWALLLLAIGFVIAAEALNTAIEAVVDLASPEIHPLAKTAKDVAAGGVLLAALTAAAVGLLILGPPLWERLMILRG